MTTLETIEAITKDIAALGFALGALATVLAHLPFMPAVWAERFARFAAYTSQAFSVNKREPTKPEAEPVARPHIVIANKENDMGGDGPPTAALSGMPTLLPLWLALGLSAGLFCSGACSPAANQKLETAGKEAIECTTSPAFAECEQSFACSGDDQICRPAIAAHTAKCLELCKAQPVDAGAD
jgi:hypothetical protein